MASCALRAIASYVATLCIAQIEDAIDDGLDSITVWNDHILICSCPGIIEGSEIAVVLIALTGAKSNTLNGGIREGAPEVGEGDHLRFAEVGVDLSLHVLEQLLQVVQHVCQVEL